MLCPDYAELMMYGALVIAITMIASALSAYVVCQYLRNGGDNDDR